MERPSRQVYSAFGTISIQRAACLLECSLEVLIGEGTRTPVHAYGLLGIQSVQHLHGLILSIVGIGAERERSLSLPSQDLRHLRSAVLLCHHLGLKFSPHRFKARRGCRRDLQPRNQGHRLRITVAVEPASLRFTLRDDMSARTRNNGTVHKSSYTTLHAIQRTRIAASGWHEHPMDKTLQT